MSSVQKILHNATNVIVDAVFINPQVKSIVNPIIPVPNPKTGSLAAEITGVFTNSDTVEFQLEVTNIGTPSLFPSKPVLSGKGNGELTNLLVIGPPAESYTIELKDIGPILTSAGISVYGLRLEIQD